jgi:hypothetical protein
LGTGKAMEFPALLSLVHILPLKMFARQKNSGFGWKLEDFEFRAAFTIVQHFHFFEKNI